ncbi:VanZ family protein [Bacillus sp. B-jedd]|uniref:VanZ family protein n=1 Tax=Bacillus sp. B-jedd TaxID=1476857 RepID=UPI0005155DEC|nr:VanZ family protein [Bacillus sp. B-jedd]CEG29157.1 VanZ like family protein [Bacillus sp. B-jedd]
MKTAVKWVASLLPFIYMAMIWIMSSLPSNHFVELPDSQIDRTIKESLHLVEFAILYGLFVIASLTGKRKFKRSINMLLAAAAALYGLTDEIHQSFYPYRSASLFDLFKDVLGIAVVYYFVNGALFRGKFPRLRRLLEKWRGYAGRG